MIFNSPGPHPPPRRSDRLSSSELPAIKRLFSRHQTASVTLRGGETLYQPGDPAQTIYRVRTGALSVFRTAGDGSRLVGVVRPGEIVGETTVFTGSPRSAKVLALRDSVIDALDAETFLAGARADAEVMVEIGRLLVARAQSAGQPVPAPRLIGLFALSGSVSAREWAEAVAAAARDLGERCALIAQEHVQMDPERWSAIEEQHDLILVPVEAEDQPWRSFCCRQIERLFVLADGRQPPTRVNVSQVSSWRAGDQPFDLLLQQKASITGTATWLEALRPTRHHHLRGTGDAARLARILTGRTVCLALSGGGARAFAHIGAAEVLREAGCSFDALGGTSMGAIVAAGLALGWNRDELDHRMRAAFVSSSPLDDIAFPFVAMTRGCKVDRRLAEHFGETCIADLPLPFLCVSSDLNSGDAVVHRQGPLAEALRASIALPGILPPVVRGQEVLADGGILRNLPTATMRAGHDGTVIAIDVSQQMGLQPGEVERPRPLLRWLRSGAWRRGPPIVSILMRSATLPSGPELAAAKLAADLYVMPDVSGIEIRNWRAYDRAVEAGRRAMAHALAGLQVPLTELRRERLGKVAERR